MRRQRPERRLALRLAAAALAVGGCLVPAGPAAALVPAGPAAVTRPAQPSGRVVLLLVQRLTWDEAEAAARRAGVPAAAGLVTTLPAGAPLAARVLSLAAGHRVDAGGTDPASVDRFRAANPDGCYLDLPPADVAAAPGLEAARLLAVRATGTPPPPRPLAGRLEPAPGRLLVLAVPGAAGLAGVLRRLPAGTRVLVAGLEPAPGRARTAPFLELGGQAGLATSDSTRRHGLVALEDVCPTLAGPGRARGDGSPIRVVAGRARAAGSPLGATARLDRTAAALVAARTWAIAVLACVSSLALVLLALAWWLAAGTRPTSSPARAARGLVLLTLALPSGYLAASMAAPPSAPQWLGLGVALGVLLAIGAAILGRPSAAGPARPSGVGPGSAAPAWLGAALLALVAGDLLLGGHGLERPLLGGSAFDGERFYGLGNGYFALALASVTVVAAFAPRLGGRAVAGLFAGLAVLDGLPALGADVGGALTAMLTAALAWLLLGAPPAPGSRRGAAGPPRQWGLARALAVLAMALAAGLALAFGVGLVTGEATHGSRFLGRLAAGGPAAAGRIVARQLGRNVSLLASSVFAWLGPFQVAAAGLLAAWPPAALATALPERVRRVTLVGALGSVVLILSNDTGVTATNAGGLFLLAILAWSLLAWLLWEAGGQASRPAPEGQASRPAPEGQAPAATASRRPPSPPVAARGGASRPPPRGR
ncbi:MAG TPA: hypothetical protein VEP73_04300 [Actinomycetota bacterium]|nr:hypothetical protein [Actinomycetota bacterium]